MKLYELARGRDELEAAALPMETELIVKYVALWRAVGGLEPAQRETFHAPHEAELAHFVRVGRV